MILLTLFCANRLGPTVCWQLAARRDEGCSYRAPGMLVLYMPPCPCLATSARWCSMFLPMPVAMTTTRHATCAGCCPSPFSACFLRRRFPRVGCCPSRIIRACRARPVDPRDQRRTGPLFAFSIFVHDTPHGCVTVSVHCVSAVRVVSPVLLFIVV